MAVFFTTMALISSLNINVFTYWLYLMAFGHFFFYGYESYFGYLKIDKNQMTKFNIFHTQKINIEDIMQVKENPNDIDIITKDDTLGIYKTAIKENDLLLLKSFLNKKGLRTA